MKSPAPHFSYPKRDRYFADPKRLGRSPDAPYMEAPFDWTEPQGDLAPVVREVERRLFYVALFMAGWFTVTALGSACYSSIAIPACDISNDRNDDREALVFFEHDEVEMMPSDPDAWSVMGYRRHITGVAIGDIVLTRDEAFETLRWQSLEHLETVMEYEA